MSSATVPLFRAAYLQGRENNALRVSELDVEDEAYIKDRNEEYSKLHVERIFLERERNHVGGNPSITLNEFPASRQYKRGRSRRSPAWQEGMNNVRWGDTPVPTILSTASAHKGTGATEIDPYLAWKGPQYRAQHIENPCRYNADGWPDGRRRDDRENGVQVSNSSPSGFYIPCFAGIRNWMSGKLHAGFDQIVERKVPESLPLRRPTGIFPGLGTMLASQRWLCPRAIRIRAKLRIRKGVLCHYCDHLELAAMTYKGNPISDEMAYQCEYNSLKASTPVPILIWSLLKRGTEEFKRGEKRTFVALHQIQSRSRITTADWITSVARSAAEPANFP
ncbi:hypothetical protein C8R45DRAFT_943523 [Mycena sanguinolenta]|nr:hypothetical protein C8R45DRAFT_943523 [Mycena sanguinolenta]